jgi:hypothetical protein
MPGTALLSNAREDYGEVQEVVTSSSSSSSSLLEAGAVSEDAGSSNSSSSDVRNHSPPQPDLRPAGGADVCSFLTQCFGSSQASSQEGQSPNESSRRHPL